MAQMNSASLALCSLLSCVVVNDNSSLEQIILKQHGLKRKLSEAEISSILTGETGGKVLILFDGYDEYAEGTNDCDCDCYCLNQASLTIRAGGRAGKFPVGGNQ